MNWILDIICIAIITLTIAFAVRNGFVKTLVSAASFLIAVFITFCFASQLSDALRSTPVADRIRESTREKIEDLVLESTGGGESLLNGENEAFNTLLGLAGYSIDEAREWVKGESHDSFAAVIADKISEPVIGAVCTALAIIILYFGTKLALAVAAWLLDKLMKLPVLRSCNKLLGAVLGAVLAVMRVMLFCFIANIIISNAEFLGADALRSIDPQKTLIFAFFSGNRLFSFFLK